MSDLFEDIANDSDHKQNVQMKSGEITGDQHLFHSLPKEFQQWHSVHYILEKEGDLDTNTIAKAQLNAYSWKIIFNATGYALSAFFLIISTVLIEKLVNNSIFTMLDMIFFFVSAIYIAYQFEFFGMIRAQVIGQLTERSSKATSILYYNTFFSTLIALLLTFIFLLIFSESILELIFTIIVDTNLQYGQDMPKTVEFFYNFGINFHNSIVTILFNNGPIYNNVFILTLGLTLFLFFSIFMVERKAFNRTRQEIIHNVSDHTLESGYPIEKSQKVITTWRSKHGM